MEDLLKFPFVDALFGRRSRRFFRGAEIPDGALAYKSRHPPLPLTELERLLILTAAAGNTGWHHSITRHDRYAPHLANYPGAAGGRTFPSAAGFHTSRDCSSPTTAAPISSRPATRLRWANATPRAGIGRSTWSRRTPRASARSPIRASGCRRASRTWRATIAGWPIVPARCC